MWLLGFAFVLKNRPYPNHYHPSLLLTPLFRYVMLKICQKQLMFYMFTTGDESDD